MIKTSLRSWWAAVNSATRSGQVGGQVVGAVEDDAASGGFRSGGPGVSAAVFPVERVALVGAGLRPGPTVVGPIGMTAIGRRAAGTGERGDHGGFVLARVARVQVQVCTVVGLRAIRSTARQAGSSPRQDGLGRPAAADHGGTAALDGGAQAVVQPAGILLTGLWGVDFGGRGLGGGPGAAPPDDARCRVGGAEVLGPRQAGQGVGEGPGPVRWRWGRRAAAVWCWSSRRAGMGR